jgi:PAS domain S-box-containing protein
MSEQIIETTRQRNKKRYGSVFEKASDGYANVKEKAFTPITYQLKKLSLLFSILVVLIAIMVLIGWAANIFFLKNFTPQWISMKVNTAICFLLTGFTLIILNGNKLEGRRKIWPSIFSLILFCLATVILLEYIFHFNAGIDELFFKDPLIVKGTASPGRPAIPTAICFFLIGIALFLITVKKINIFVFQGLNLAAGLVALFTLLGYVFGAEELTSSSFNTAISVHTSIGFLMFVLASLFLLPQSGIMKLVSSNTSGGRLIRKSFPLIILTIIITGWLSMEEQWASFYDVYFGMASYIMVVIVVFTITIFINAYSLTRSENRIKKEREFSNYLLDGIPGIFYLIDKTGGLLKWNKNFEPETGYTTAEIAGINILDFFIGEDRAFISGKLQEAFANGESTGEANLRSKTGELTAYYFTIKKIILEDNTLLLGTALNIAESRQLKEKLVASETMLKEAQRLAQLGNWELDLATGQLNWSDEIYLIFDLDPKVFGATYEAFLNAIHPDDRQYVAQSYETSVATHTSYSIDHRLQMKDGSIKFVHEQCVTFYDEEDHAIRSIGTVQDITERKLVEEQQKSVSIYTRSLIEASLDPLVTISPKGKITDVNQATIKVTGIERSKLIGTDFSDYFTEPDRARQGYQQVLEQGFVTDYPLTIHHSNGNLTDVLYNASIYRDASGKAMGVFAAARDVTVQKKAEKELRKSEKKYRSLFENMMEGYALCKMLYNDKGIPVDILYEEVNPTFYKLTGFKNVVGHKFSEVYPGRMEKHPELLETYSKVIATGKGEKIENYVEQLNMWMAISIYPFDKDHFTSVFEDITDRKENEKALQQASLYNRSLIEASLDPLVTISPEGKITDVNQATIKVTGVEKSKLVGTDFSNYFTEPCKAKSGYQSVFEEGFVTDYPLTIRNSNGKLTEVLYNASVYEDVSGKILGVFAAARDVTAQKHAEEQLHKLNTTLEEKVKERTFQFETVNKELEAFTYSVSHDLRSPLRAVNSYSQILCEDYSERLGDDGKLILENIKYNTVKMGKLIDELLAFSRLGRKQLERTEIDMNELVNEVLDELNKSVEHHAEIKPGQLPTVKADQTLMHQVMLNLISNAVKYSSKKEKPAIEICAEENEGKTVFAVKDNGVGFDMRFADKLFGVFQRLHSEKEFEGNGVGLAIVKRIINKHGGEVWGTAEENKGANFYFTLN